MWGGRKWLPNNGWLNGLYGQTPEKPRPFLDRGRLGQRVRPGIAGAGRSCWNVRLVVASEESGEATHFERGRGGV